MQQIAGTCQQPTTSKIYGAPFQNITTTIPVIKNESSQDEFVKKNDANSSNNKNSDKKKTALIIGGIALGTVAIAGGIYVAKHGGIKSVWNTFKGKISNKGGKKVIEEAADKAKNESEKIASEMPSDFQKGVKKFQSKTGEIVEGVELKNGKAVLKDGSAFSGKLSTMNKKGQTVEILYKDGFMEQSSINGNLKKTYINFSADIPKNKAQRITTFDKNGEAIDDVINTYYNDGKIDSVWSHLKDGKRDDTVTKFYKGGKTEAKIKIGNGELFYPEKATVFYEDGITPKTVYTNNNGIKTAKTYSKEGKLLSEKEIVQFINKENLPTAELGGSKLATFYKPNGEVDCTIDQNFLGGFDVFGDKEMENVIARITPGVKKLPSIPSDINEYMKNCTKFGGINHYEKGKAFYIANNGIFCVDHKNNLIETIDSNDEKFKSALSTIKKAAKLAEKENMDFGISTATGLERLFNTIETFTEK